MGERELVQCDVVAPILRWTVNYSQRWVHNYTSFTIVALAAGYENQIFDHLEAFGNLSHVDSSYPSWVPNWTRRRSSRGFTMPDVASVTCLEAAEVQYPGMISSCRTIFAYSEQRKTGDDPVSGQYATIECVIPPIPIVATTEALRDRIKALWKEFAEFKDSRASFTHLLTSRKTRGYLKESTRLRQLYNLDKIYGTLLMWCASTKIKYGDQIFFDLKIARSTRNHHNENHQPREEHSELSILEAALLDDIILPVVRERLSTGYLVSSKDLYLRTFRRRPSSGRPDGDRWSF